jgi:hypothetical protein
MVQLRADRLGSGTGRTLQHHDHLHQRHEQNILDVDGDLKAFKTTLLIPFLTRLMQN